MALVTSGDVIRKAREEGVPEQNLDDFVRRFHAKTQYLAPEHAFAACLIDEKRVAFSGRPGQVANRGFTNAVTM
ncbi:MAG: hypothetical protein MAG453_00272 [Calditrichaeota bacterium]|nr:hypothetical protein [Calditrichota bacterium]